MINLEQLYKQVLQESQEDFKPKGKFQWNGLTIIIENNKGDVRKGIDKNGHKWKIVMKSAYGYIENTSANDGDGLDVFVVSTQPKKFVYKITQIDPETKKFDELKIMIGCDSEEQAKKKYLENYDKPDFFGGIEAISTEKFVSHIKDYLHTKEKYEKHS
jgi:hypothetical protein